MWYNLKHSGMQDTTSHSPFFLKTLKSRQTTHLQHKLQTTTWLWTADCNRYFFSKECNKSPQMAAPNYALFRDSFHATQNLIQIVYVNPLKPELNPICYLLALLGAHHFLHVNRIRVKSLTFRLLMSYTYGAPILDVSRSHTTTQHSR